VEERRTYKRFVVPGATVRYRRERLFFASRYSDDLLPVFDLSRGGLRFLSQEFLDISTRLSLRFSVPGEGAVIDLSGRAVWVSTNPERSYKYQVGVRFEPFSGRRGENDPSLLERLADLEERFSG
jgi:hypothetical protein